MIPLGPLPVEEWPGVLVGLMEHIERQREPLTTCAGCGALVRPSEHCTGCTMDAHLDDMMAAACRRETWRGEAGKVKMVDLWAVLLSLPFIWLMVEGFNRF